MIHDFINKMTMYEKIKKKNFFLKFNKKYINLIKYLIRINIIKFAKIKQKKIFLKINLLKNDKMIFKINNIYKSSDIKYSNLKFLKKLYNKKYFLILSTNKGIKNNFESLKKKTGGILLLLLWN